MVSQLLTGVRRGATGVLGAASLVVCLLALLCMCLAGVTQADDSSFTVSSLSPALGSVNGGTIVTFTLRNRPGDDPLVCHFGMYPGLPAGAAPPVGVGINTGATVSVAAVRVSFAAAIGDDPQYQCTSPSWPVASQVDFWVSTGVNITQWLTYTYYPVLDLLPSRPGWTQVDQPDFFFPLVNASIQPLPAVLDPNAVCVFTIDGVEVGRSPLIRLTAAVMRCTSPALNLTQPTTALFSVSLNGQDYSHTQTTLFFNEPIPVAVDPPYVYYMERLPMVVRTAPNALFPAGHYAKALWELEGLGGSTQPLTVLDNQTAALTSAAMSASQWFDSFYLFLSLDDGQTFSRTGLVVPVLRRCSDLPSCDLCVRPQVDGTECGWCDALSFCINATSVCPGPQGPQPASTSCTVPPPPPPPSPPSLSVIIGLSVAGGSMIIVGLAVCILHVRRRQRTVYHTVE